MHRKKIEINPLREVKQGLYPFLMGFMLDFDESCLNGISSGGGDGEGWGGITSPWVSQEGTLYV